MATLERDHAIALNRRDAYGVVVARLIEWFGDSSNGEFEVDDYRAIMIDAGLMDDDYRLTETAREIAPKESPKA